MLEEKLIVFLVKDVKAVKDVFILRNVIDVKQK